MADLVRLLTEKYFPESQGMFIAGGVPVSQLAEAYGTPFFLYDQGVLDRKHDVLRATLPERFSIYYSMKANPCPAVVKHFVKRGCGIEIASAGELHGALEAGCDPERILFAGPGKSDVELELALSHRIGEIHVESLVEARRIALLCRQFGRRMPIAARINASGEAEGGAMRMGGRSAPFGIDEECITEVLDALQAEPELDLCGIHVFSGTQILNADILVSQYRHALKLGRQVARRLGRPLRRLDFGGGLGVPYFSNERELDLESLRESLLAVCEDVDSDPDFAGTQFLVEPGRFLTAEAGVYVARILDVKASRGKKFLILDGGMNHHLAASGNLGQTIKRNYPIALLNKLNAPAVEAVDIVGPLCTPLDTLARGIVLPPAEIGDLVGIFQSGAYGRSASPLGFLSHPAPPEILVHRTSHTMILGRGEASNFVLRQRAF